MSVNIYYLYFVITLSVFSITATSFQAFAVEEVWEDYERMGEMVKDIRNGGKDDDKVDYNKFKDSSVYKSAKEDVRNCIDLANKVGEKLGDYEIVRCYENTNYFEEKYVDDDGRNTDVNRQDIDNQNMTRSNAIPDADQREQEQQQEQQQQERLTSNKSDTSTSDDITANNLIDELITTGKFTEDEAKEFVSQNILSGVNITSASDDASTNDKQATPTDEQQREQEQEQEQQETVDQNRTRPQIITNSSQAASSKSDSNSTEVCDPSYPEICITTYSAKLTCGDIPFRNFKVILPDPHGFDSDADGIGCEE